MQFVCPLVGMKAKSRESRKMIDRAAELWRTSLDALGLRRPSDGQTYTGWAKALELAVLRINDCLMAEEKEEDVSAQAI